MNIAIVGTGYVGLVTGACFAEAGNHVTCIDSNSRKIAGIRKGELPFYEPGLLPLVDAGAAGGTLHFTDRLDDGIKNAQVVFLAVGTPSAADGCANVDKLLQCAGQLAQTLDHSCTVVVKSTAPVGTCERVQAIFDQSLPARCPGASVDVAANPEFLAEGRAVADFRKPTRIVTGTSGNKAHETLQSLYAPFDPLQDRLLNMDVRSAEFAKYACNAMLAARISLINELAGIAGTLGADIGSVCRVLTSDPRIGASYLHPGVGYGGSCLPKDLRALIRMAEDQQEPASILRSVELVNQRQVRLLFEAIADEFNGRLSGRCIAVWGLAFKPGTDDIREAPSLALIRMLADAGATIRGYDPVAAPHVSRLKLNPGIILTDTALMACDGSDALVVMTEWDEFKTPDFTQIASRLKGGTVFDGRHLYRSADLENAGLKHRCLGQRKETTGFGHPYSTLSETRESVFRRH